MLINLRQHIITLVAVFLALAVGLLVGGSFTNGSATERLITKSLEKEFSKIRKENDKKQSVIKDLTERNKRHTEFESTIIPALVSNQLARRRVAIIQTGDYSSATQSVKSVLEAAGARVVSMTTLSDLQSVAAQMHAGKALAAITGETDVQDPIRSVLSIIGDLIVSGSDGRDLDILEDQGLLLKSGEYNRRVMYIVIVGGGKESDGFQRVQTTDLVLIDELKEAGAQRVVGVEPANTVYSYMSDYHSKEIPTIDNIDEPMGQVALVYVVKGESGHFGIKESSDRVTPAFLESKEWLSKFRR